MDWRSETYLGITPSSHDWARLAAFIDGEGSINFSVRKPSAGQYNDTLMGRIQVTNTDVRLIKWCAETFGMNMADKPHSPGRRKGNEHKWKPCMFATATSFRACWILHNCLPWFILKRDQALIILDHQSTTVVGLWERGVGKKTPQDILEYRSSLRRKLAELNKRGLRQDGEEPLAKEA